MGLARGESGLGRDSRWTRGLGASWGGQALGVWLRRLGGKLGLGLAYLFGRKLPDAGRRPRVRLPGPRHVRHARSVQDAIGLGAKMGGIASADAIAAVRRDGAARRLACGLPSNEAAVSACRRDAVIGLGLGLAGSKVAENARLIEPWLVP